MKTKHEINGECQKRDISEILRCLVKLMVLIALSSHQVVGLTSVRGDFKINF